MHQEGGLRRDSTLSDRNSNQRPVERKKDPHSEADLVHTGGRLVGILKEERHSQRGGPSLPERTARSSSSPRGDERDGRRSMMLDIVARPSSSGRSSYRDPGELPRRSGGGERDGPSGSPLGGRSVGGRGLGGGRHQQMGQFTGEGRHQQEGRVTIGEGRHQQEDLRFAPLSTKRPRSEPGGEMSGGRRGDYIPSDGSRCGYSPQTTSSQHQSDPYIRHSGTQRPPSAALSPGRDDVGHRHQRAPRSPRPPSGSRQQVPPQSHRGTPSSGQVPPQGRGTPSSGQVPSQGRGNSQFPEGRVGGDAGPSGSHGGPAAAGARAYESIGERMTSLHPPRGAPCIIVKLGSDGVKITRLPPKS